MIRYRSTNDSVCRWAVFYLLGRVLSTLRPLMVDLGALGSLAMIVYLTGLITQQNITLTEIAAQVGLVSHDSLRRMLAGLGVGLSQGVCLSVRLVQALGGAPGWLIIDDVLLPKVFAKAIELCFWDWDHAARRNCFGQRLVFVLWSNGRLVVPLLFTFWQKDPTRKPKPKKAKRAKTKKSKGAGTTRRRRRKPGTKRTKGQSRVRVASGARYRTKNELARAMVWRLIRRGLPAQFVLFDNWYASDDNFKLFERLKLFWVTRSKDNYTVQYEGRTLPVKQVANSVLKAHYHYYASLGARARSFAVSRNGRALTLTVIKDDRGPESGRTKYLLTNATGLTVCQVIEWYRRRWTIEVFFRDCKQYLGLGRSEVRHADEIISHIVLVCIAYTVLQLLKPSANEKRPSVRAGKHALAPLALLVLPSGEHCAERHLPNGSVEVFSFEHWLEPFRTRLPGLPLAENLVFP